MDVFHTSSPIEFVTLSKKWTLNLIVPSTHVSGAFICLTGHKGNLSLKAKRRKRNKVALMLTIFRRVINTFIMDYFNVLYEAISQTVYIRHSSFISFVLPSLQFTQMGLFLCL